MSTNKILKYIIYSGLFLVPFVPFVLYSDFFFPYITGKAFAFRIIVEIIFAAWIFLAYRDEKYRPKFSSPINIIILAFIAIMALVDAFAVNPFKAFWSNFERMEGFVSLAHLAAFFFVASTMLDTKKLWHKFFNTSIFASLLVSFYGLFQLFGWIEISQGGVRLDSTLGNAAYLAVYLMMHIFLCLYFLLDENASNQSWRMRWVYGTVAVFQTILLYFTETRGAIIGFILGLIIFSLLGLFTEKNRKWLKKTFIIFLSAAIILVGGFLLLKNTKFIRENRTLSRFSSISFTEKTTISRFLVWNMAFEGFKERPLLGWGQEGFNYVFNKNYDPKMYGQESWFDRTHNVFLDWLIAGGILGLLSYLALVSWLVYALWKNNRLDPAGKSVLTGAVAGYFIHNLFVFDNLTSYIILFSLLGFAHVLSISREETQEEFGRNYSSRVQDFEEKFEPQDYAVAVAVFALLILGIYFINIRAMEANYDLVQASVYTVAKPEISLDYFKKALSYGSFGQTEIRERLIYSALGVMGSGSASNQIKKDFATLAMTEIDGQIKQTPQDARYYYFAGSFLGNLKMFKEAIPYFSKAGELSPKKQQILFSLGESYMNSSQPAKALETFKKAFELNPDVDDARIYYAGTAIYTGSNDLADSLLKERFGTDLVPNDFLVGAYTDTKQYDKVIGIMKNKLAENPKDFQSEMSLAAAYFLNGQKVKSIEILNQMIIQNPDFKTQGERYISDIKAGKNPIQ